MRFNKIMYFILTFIFLINLIACTVGKDDLNVSKAMGRYVEEVIPLPAELIYSSRLFENKDGNAIIVDPVMRSSYVSDADIANFTTKHMNMLDAFSNNTCIERIVLAKNGSAIIKYVNGGNGEGEEKESDSEKDFDYNPGYLYISADGTAKQLPIDLKYISDFDFSNENHLYACDVTGGVYEIDYESGKVTSIYNGNNSVLGFNVLNDYIIWVDSESVYLYDFSTKQVEVNPEVLTEFMNSEERDTSEFRLDTRCCYFHEGNDNDIYILTKSGLYRYIVGGTSVEQLINGDLNCISNPAYKIVSFLQDKNGDFIVLYGNGKLMRYAYNPDMLSVPESILKIYSLSESKTLRQAVSQYQILHPDVYVQYEVGKSGNDGSTSEDTIKNLNIEILSGSGPDILLLDGLPMKSYIEKGILEDLLIYQDTINANQSLLKNITESMATDKHLYAMPAKFELPIIVAKEDTLNKIHNFASLTDEMEMLRKSDKENHIANYYTEKEIIEDALAFYENEMVTTDGIDKDMLTNMLNQCKRIYDVEKQIISEKDIKMHNMMAEK